MHIIPSKRSVLSLIDEAYAAAPHIDDETLLDYSEQTLNYVNELLPMVAGIGKSPRQQQIVSDIISLQTFVHATLTHRINQAATRPTSVEDTPASQGDKGSAAEGSPTRTRVDPSGADSDHL